MRPSQAHKRAAVSKFIVAPLYSQMANASDLVDRLALGDAALVTAHRAAPQQKRMRFTTKQALVITLSQNTPDPPETPFAFYVDTDDEKIAFIDWFVEHFQSGGFQDFADFEAREGWLPGKRQAIYFEAKFGTEGKSDPRKQERLFPIADEGEKLALFAYIAAGELDMILCPCGNGVHINQVKAAVKLDAEEATAAIAQTSSVGHTGCDRKRGD